MRILLGMSGGLDSTYAAVRLREQGHEVCGAVIRMHEYTDLSAARLAAREAGVDIVELDCTDAFHREIEAGFAAEYLAGRTPNPCVDCNAAVKLRALADHAVGCGFDAIATGHYARVERLDNGRYAICRAADPKKDQSYVLWKLPQDILSILMLPLGDVSKSEVRSGARVIGLSQHDAEESQEICFIPDNDYASFIEKNYAVSAPGDFVDREGRVLGRHKGILHYTIGQRRGLGIACGERIFVSDIDAASARITLSSDDALYRSRIRVDELVFSGDLPRESGEGEYMVKLRYLAPPIRALVRFGAGEATVELETPARAPTPGQSAVFYRDGGICFGGKIRLCE